MKVGAVIQARMSSARLPGKVLLPLAGRTMMDRLLDRLERAAQVDVVAVATSTDGSDDPIERAVAARGIPCVRGDLHDVAGRFLEAASSLGLDAFVRVNGDSPLMDPQLVDAAAASIRTGEFDLVTNVSPRRFPKGQSVEAVAAAAMADAHGRMDGPGQREHVTRWFYDHPDETRIHRLVIPDEGDWSDVVLTVDTPEDARAIERLLEGLDRPVDDYGWRELAELRRRL
jgi:spore coat polysaccharide biosynthesis protein SpsF